MKVVCINDKSQIQSVLKEGETYTVKGTVIWSGALLLVEVYNGGQQPYHYFYGHKQDRFMPLDDYLSLESEIQECLTRELQEC